MEVDYTPVINAALGLAAIALTAFGSWALKRLADWLGVQRNSAAVQGFDAALARAIQAGAGEANDLIAARGWGHAEVRNQVVAFAAQYAISKFAPALREVGLDPTDPAGATTAYLTSELNRIFPTAMAPVAASPVTPPVPQGEA